MGDWQQIMEETGRAYKQDALDRRKHLQAVGIEAIITEYQRGEIDFNALKSYLIEAKHFPPEYIDHAIELIKIPADEMHLCGFDLLIKAKPVRAIPALLDMLDSEYGWTVEKSLKSLLAIGSTRKDISEKIRHYIPKLGNAKLSDKKMTEEFDLLKMDDFTRQIINDLIEKLRKRCG